MSTIVTRAGKGSALTHNEVDANFNNLNNDKVEDLSDLSITSSAAELNILDGVTATAAELNKTDDSAAAVSSYVSGMRTYVHVNGHNATSFNAATNITEATFESIGPTGSSATNIWTAMDDMPAAATIAIVSVEVTATPSATDSTTAMSAYIRQTGSATAVGNTTAILNSSFANDDYTGTAWLWKHTFFIPLDSSRRFDFTWAISGDSARGVSLYLQGFIV